MRRSGLGFTLIEIMVAIALFSVLAVAVYSVMKSTMESTVRQKTQQAANDNARALLNTVTTELKSSYRERAELSFTAGEAPHAYLSSVICPATAQASTCRLNDNLVAKTKLVAPSIKDADGRQALQNNVNRTAFFVRTNDGKFRVVEYRVLAANNRCIVDRIVYNWANSNLWFGLSMGGSVAGLVSVDSNNVRFSNTLGTAVSRETVMELPNRGDAAVLYVARGWDDTYSPAKLAANQFLVKVVILQTIKSNDAFNYPDSDPIVWGNGIVGIVTGTGSKRAVSMSRNYRVAEMESAVNVSY